MAHINQIIRKYERRAHHDMMARERMDYVLPILVRCGIFLALLSFALVWIFRINGGSLIMPISFTIHYAAGVLIAVLLWQPRHERRLILEIIFGCLVMVVIVLITWKYVSSQLDIGWPAHSPHYRGS